MTNTTAPAVQRTMERNKAIVREFYDALINRKDFASARRYMAPRYIQHSATVADGPEGLNEFVQFLKRNYPDARSTIMRMFADGDFVIAHVHSIRIPGMPGRAIVDIFRLADGLVAEHWDVVQDVPPELRHPNGMF